jgi:hypothetical protein
MNGETIDWTTRRHLCAHADDDGRGMHWLEPGERCPDDATYSRTHENPAQPSEED